MGTVFLWVFPGACNRYENSLAQARSAEASANPVALFGPEFVRLDGIIKKVPNVAAGLTLFVARALQTRVMCV